MNNTIKIADLMDSSNVRFGTSGARGLVADMSDMVCYAYTLGFIQYLKNEWCQRFPAHVFSAVAVAGDLRPSTPRIMEAVSRAVHDSGLEVINSGEIPSPALALYGMQHGMPAIMVTGSHIPDDRNGIKYNTPLGEILKSDEAGIKEQVVRLLDLFTAEGLFAKGSAVLGSVDSGAKVGYIDRWLQAFPVDFLKGMDIGVYQHSAVGRDIMNLVLSRMGAVVVPLARSEDFIPVDTEAIRQEDIDFARKTATEYRLDAIVSTDGDSDRPLISDEYGNWLRGDIAGILTADYLEADCVVTPVSSNTAVELCEKFEIVARTKIGSPYVISMLEKLYKENPGKRVVGYEANGGFLQMSPLEINGRTLAPLPTRDPLIVHLAILGMIRKFGLPISELVKWLPQRVGASNRLQGVPVAVSRKKISELLSGSDDVLDDLLPGLGKVRQVDDTDGIRMVFENGDIVHFRPSGNAPELRCYVEGQSQERADYLLQCGLEVLKSWF